MAAPPLPWMVCRDCGETYALTDDELSWMASVGKQHVPTRCLDCRRLQRAHDGRSRRGTLVVCAQCGKQAIVPFTPKEGRPVYCDDCFHRGGG